MKQQLKGEYYATASGGRLYSFLNAMHQENIGCRAQRCVGEYYQFRFDARFRSQVESLAKDFGITLTLTERRTLRQFLRRYRLRFGIPLGILLMGGFLFYTSNIVITTEIIGNETATDSEIYAILAEQGVTRGSWIPSIDFSACEHALRAGVEELAWVGMRHTGNRLVIEVMEREPEVDQLRARIPCNIIATQDAQIVSVSVYCGQLIPMVGDSVQKGSLLISGVIMDLTGHAAVRHAMGSIIGIYTQTETFTCPYVQQVRNPTGAQTGRRYLDLFTWHIPLGSTDDPYEESIQTTGYHWFSLFGAQLPIGIYTRTYHEYRTHLLAFTPEEASQNLAEQAERYEANFLNDVEILDKETAVLETEDGLEWTITYTLQGEIGMQQELYIQDRDVSE